MEGVGERDRPCSGRPSVAVHRHDRPRPVRGGCRDRRRPRCGARPGRERPSTTTPKLGSGGRWWRYERLAQGALVDGQRRPKRHARRCCRRGPGQDQGQAQGNGQGISRDHGHRPPVAADSFLVCLGLGPGKVRPRTTTQDRGAPRPMPSNRCRRSAVTAVRWCTRTGGRITDRVMTGVRTTSRSARPVPRWCPPRVGKLGPQRRGGGPATWTHRRCTARSMRVAEHVHSRSPRRRLIPSGHGPGLLRFRFLEERKLGAGRRQVGGSPPTRNGPQGQPLLRKRGFCFLGCESSRGVDGPSFTWPGRGGGAASHFPGPAARRTPCLVDDEPSADPGTFDGELLSRAAVVDHAARGSEKAEVRPWALFKVGYRVHTGRRRAVSRSTAGPGAAQSRAARFGFRAIFPSSRRTMARCRRRLCQPPFRAHEDI